MYSSVRDKLTSTMGWDIPYICSINHKHRLILLCLHGFAGDKDSSVIKALMDQFDEDGIGVMTFDWPAHGESDAADHELTVDNCLNDLDIVVTWLVHKYSIPLSCFATSFGGYLATLYRNEHPNVFQDLILRSPALKMNEDFRELIPEEEFAAMMQGKDFTTGFDRKMCIGRKFYKSLCNHDAFSLKPPHPENMLIIQGDSDLVVNPKDTQEYADKNGINLIVFHGTDHVYKKSGEKEQIVEETKKFLFRNRF